MDGLLPGSLDAVLLHADASLYEPLHDVKMTKFVFGRALCGWIYLCLYHRELCSCRRLWLTERFSSM